MLKILPYLIIALILNSCGTKVPQNDDLGREVQLVSDFENYQNSAPVNFESVVLTGDILTLKFSYSGGCEKHEFALVGMEAMAKSLPPIRSIVLYHNNNGDSCRELITETLSYNIALFGYQSGKEIKLMLEGWEEPIMYTLP